MIELDKIACNCVTFDENEVDAVQLTGVKFNYRVLKLAVMCWMVSSIDHLYVYKTIMGS